MYTTAATECETACILHMSHLNGLFNNGHFKAKNYNKYNNFLLLDSNCVKRLTPACYPFCHFRDFRYHLF